MEPNNIESNNDVKKCYVNVSDQAKAMTTINMYGCINELNKLQIELETAIDNDNINLIKSKIKSQEEIYEYLVNKLNNIKDTDEVIVYST